MKFGKLAVAALGGLIASLSPAPNALATGDVWLEGSYEHLALPDVQFVNRYKFNFGTFSQRDEFVNDDGEFDGFRIDGGIANVPIMGGAYVVGVKGFFAWHDDKQDLRCSNNISVASGSICTALPLIDNVAVVDRPSTVQVDTQQFTTERDVDHWGLALELARGPHGLKAGPAFRRIDQDTTITGGEINSGPIPDPYQLTYSEDLETNYWGAFVGAGGAIDLGAGWSLQGDAEAGLYWANTEYTGHYVVTNANTAAFVNPNVNQTLSLESDELAFIGVLKATLEKDLGLFKLAGFGRFEYISSAPDIAYNDFDLNPIGRLTGSHDETRLGERYAYTLSAGARVTVPMGSGQ